MPVLKKPKHISDAVNLRRKAENQLNNMNLNVNANSSEGDIRKLVHELQMYRIELEMQNEELVLAKELISEAAIEKYKELYELAPTAYFTISKEGNIRELNLKGACMLGNERQRLLNLKFGKFITRDTILIFDDFLRKVFGKETVETCEVTLSVNPPVNSFIYLTGHVIEDGKLCLLSVIDITPRKKAEAELKNKIDELTKAYKQLEEYSFHNQELKEFANISSHELQQPLRSMYNYIQIYEKEYGPVIDDKAQTYLNIIKDSARRMYELINALSEYSRVGMNKTLRLVDFKKLIENVISDLNAVIISARAKILFSQLPVINAYEIEIHQVFLNLITNAIKFHRKTVNPVVHVGSEWTGNAWKFSVRDNGIGISPSHFGKLFTMFQRLHSDEGEFEGKGIGLAICKKIVELHRGKIWAESNRDNGITIYFTIPALTL